LSDLDLLSRCRGGDSAAWATLVGRYGEFVFSVCRATGLSETDAADVTQQTFCLLRDNLDRLKGEMRIGGWLATVAKRHSWRLRTRLQRESATDPDTLSQSIEAEYNERLRTASWEQLEWLNHGLTQIDERCRNLLTELYLREDAFSYEEVAERLGISVGSIGPTRARCLSKLRTLLESP
jgi:RNA polymerase sigma factor (sigma-70 family)